MHVGERIRIRGNITTLDAVGVLPARSVERNLGFATGRLARGYFIVVLKQPLTPDDFEFDGITLRSDGRMGLPAATAAEDLLRPRVHDQMLREYGAAGYRDMQIAALKSVPLTGGARLAKVIPMIAHDPKLAPAEQYPMGEGRWQWRLIRDCDALVALWVDHAGIATTATARIDIALTAPYEDRVRVRRYLETV